MKLARVFLLVAALAAVAGCGGGGGDKPAQSPKVEARAAVQGYLKALGRSDATAVCAAFSVKSRADIATFGHDKLGSEETCTGALQTLLKGQGGARLKALGAAKVLDVSITGTTGKARVEGLDAPVGVVREGGEWRIRSQPTGETN